MLQIALLASGALTELCLPADDDALKAVAVSPSAEAIAAADPDVVVAIDPSDERRALVERLDRPALLWWPAAPPVATPRPDQRVVTASPLRRGVWRSAPLPVADRLYSDGSDDAAAADTAAWLGPPTARRAGYLGHFVHGHARFAAEGERAAIAVNLHEDGPDCEHRALVALARGQLLVSETLVPARGVEAGIDYLEARDLDDVHLAVENAARAPDAFRRVRLSGRRTAELFRASRLVARLAGDLLRELGRDPARAR